MPARKGQIMPKVRSAAARTAAKVARKVVRRYRGPGGRRRYRRNLKSMMFNYPLGQSYTTKLKYVEYFSINPPIVGAGVYAFSCNGLFDPNYSGGGHQPHGFDQLMTFYNHYQVIGAKITVKALPTVNVSSTAVPFVFGINTDDDTTLVDITSMPSQLEQPLNKRKVVCNPAAADTRSLTLTSKVSLKKFFKVSAFKGHKEYMGNSSANPTEQAYFVVWAGNTDGATDIPSTNFIAEIEYIAIFTEPKDISYS